MFLFCFEEAEKGTLDLTPCGGDRDGALLMYNVALVFFLDSKVESSAPEACGPMLEDPRHTPNPIGHPCHRLPLSAQNNERKCFF